MHISQWIAFGVALASWGGFTIMMRKYFRFARQRSTAKSWLIFSAFACTAAQFVGIVTAGPISATWLCSGIAVFGLANLLFWWALSAHGKSHPAFAFIQVAPESLTTAGPYRLVRHPIYSAYLLGWCAGAVITAQPWLLLTVVYMGTFYLVAAQQEEKTILASALASSYEEYQRHTGMFFPKLTALVPGR